MEDVTEIIPVKLGDDEILVEATIIGGDENVSNTTQKLEKAIKTVRKLADTMLKGLDEISPDKAVLEFSVELALESGELTALIAKGSSKSNFKITLEWNSK